MADAPPAPDTPPAPEPDAQEPMLPFDQVMERLDLGRAALYRQVKDGALEAVKTDHALVFAESEVARFEARRAEDQATLRQALDQWLATLAQRLAAHGHTDLPDLAEKTDEELAAELARRILLDAAAEGVTDVHLDPLEAADRLLYRFEGNLKEVGRLPAPLAAALKAKLKDLAPPPPPEAGPGLEAVVKQTLADTETQLHLQAAPTVLGEHIHVHIYEPEDRLRIDTLGYTPEQVGVLRGLLTGRPGLILVAGAGDVAADRHRLAFASELAAAGRLVVSLEHRPHRRSELLVQLEVGNQEAPGFGPAARIALDMGPDIVLADEVRDAAEARALLEMAAAGSLVVADVQAAGAIEALLRLVAMEVSREGIATTLLAIVERRALRRLCPHCRAARPLADGEAAQLAADPGTQVFEPAHCDICGDGFLGRRMLHGLLLADAELPGLIRTLEPPAQPLFEWRRRSPHGLAHAAPYAILAGDVALRDAALLLETDAG